jgi:folate-binding protein YgfZ
MPKRTFCKLGNRSILGVSGSDSRAFLQGLISNDIEKVSHTRTIYSTFLTPQGKYLFDFFISQSDDRLLIDCEKARIADFMKRLRLYKLRADVEIIDCSDEFDVFAYWGDGAIEASGLTSGAGSAQSQAGGVVYVDPRLAEAGLRAVIAVGSDTSDAIEARETQFNEYENHRLTLGLPESSRDLIVDKSILLESGIDDLNGIDWQKGCYMGQEVTARSKYRGLVKKRLLPVDIDGPIIEAGTSIMAGDRQAGEMRSSVEGRGIALIRLEYLDGNESFSVADHPEITLTPRKPSWANF